MKINITPALSHEALYNKSKLYIKRGLQAKHDKNNEEYQLWASLALELLAKSSLSSIHPSLIADPTHQNSIFAACCVKSSSDIKTIPAKTLFNRLSHILEKFDTRVKDFCDQLSLQRNAELHSGESPFSGKNNSWEGRYWHAIQLTLSLQEKDLNDWLGDEDAKATSEIIKETKSALKMSIDTRIQHAKEDFEKKYTSKTKKLKAIEESKNLQYWKYISQMRILADEHEIIKCPSCSSNSILGGVVWQEDAQEDWEHLYDEDCYDEPMELVIKTCRAEEFLCPTCGLKLEGTEEIEVAGLELEFEKEEERVREFQAEYGNE